MKKSAMGSNEGGAGSKSEKGYQLLHVLIVAIVFLIIGAMLMKK